MKLSVVIPAYNEAENLPKTIGVIYDELVKESIEHEILVSNDNSEDNTAEVIEELEKKNYAPGSDEVRNILQCVMFSMRSPTAMDMRYARVWRTSMAIVSL